MSWITDAESVERRPPADALVKGWFHSLDEQDAVEWQGRVISPAYGGCYIVQLYSWLGGCPTVQTLVPASAMRRWRFFSSILSISRRLVQPDTSANHHHSAAAAKGQKMAHQAQAPTGPKSVIHINSKITPRTTKYIVTFSRSGANGRIDAGQPVVPTIR